MTGETKPFWLTISFRILAKLSDIRLEDGLAFLEKRRSVLIGPDDKKRHVAPGTIERECAALMAVLNLAVDMDHLDKNRLKRLPVPEYVKRERIAEGGSYSKSERPPHRTSGGWRWPRCRSVFGRTS
jgi:hypothetical protein